MEVSLLSRLLVARVLAWGSGLESWDGVGEAGGAWEGGRRSLIWPPWNVLRTVDPLERREDGVEDEDEETPEAPAMLWVEGEAGGRRWDRELFSLPFCSRECRSLLDRSVQTYVFLLVMALAGMLFVVELTSLRRSGISDLLGLWAELTMGLEGVGMLREPTALALGLRIDRRSSLSPAPSPTPLGLRLG